MPDPTQLPCAIVVDRGESAESTGGDAEGGVNAFIAAQRAQASGAAAPGRRP